MQQQAFKQRVAQAAIEYAEKYEDVFLKYEYLLCSEAFAQCEYYLIAAHEENYRHLIGVSTEMSAADFFRKCRTGELEADDFTFVKKGQTEAAVKGSVRRKILALPDFISMMGMPLLAQENYVKNKVRCSFATTDRRVTVGFTASGKSRPMTLLRGNELDSSKCYAVDLILRRKAGNPRFDEIVYGDPKMVYRYISKIRPLLTDDLIPDEAMASV